jgi:hypothetical protein
MISLHSVLDGRGQRAKLGYRIKEKLLQIFATLHLIHGGAIFRVHSLGCSKSCK